MIGRLTQAGPDRYACKHESLGAANSLVELPPESAVVNNAETLLVKDLYLVI